MGVTVPSAWELGTKMRVWDALRGYRPWRRHGRAGIRSERDKARAEGLIRDLFRRLEERGGDVDRWETEHTLSALGRYMASEYGKAAEHINLAGIPAARRSAKAVSKLERAYGDRFQPDLRTLEAIFADLVKRQGDHPN